MTSTNTHFQFAVKIIGDIDDAYDYIKQFDGEDQDKAQAAFDKDCENVSYFLNVCPLENKDEALNEAGSLFREFEITERYEENWGKIAEVIPLDEIKDKDVEAVLFWDTDEDNELILKEELDMTEGYTREEFLDEFNHLDAQRLGLKFPEPDEHISSDDRDELNEEFWFEVFIPHLELKLWDCLEAEETKYELGSIVSFWENVA